MVEELSPYILAPFIKEIDPDTYTATLNVPEGIRARMQNPAFLVNAFPDRPTSVGTSRIQLNEVRTTNDSEKVTIDELVEAEFGLKNREWSTRVDKAMKKRGFIQDQTGWIDEQVSNVAMRNSRDDLFTVRIDNLPEQMSQHMLADRLIMSGCDYFTKIVVPRDVDAPEINGQPVYKRFGFVKFDKLRYALKFLEDHRKIQVASMILTSTLAV